MCEDRDQEDGHDSQIAEAQRAYPGALNRRPAPGVKPQPDAGLADTATPHHDEGREGRESKWRRRAATEAGLDDNLEDGSQPNHRDDEAARPAGQRNDAISEQ